MQTTLNIDEDVARMLRDAHLETTNELSKLVNELLRGQPNHSKMKAPKAKLPYRTPSHDAGRLLIQSIDDIDQVLEDLDGAWRR